MTGAFSGSRSRRRLVTSRLLIARDALRRWPMAQWCAGTREGIPGAGASPATSVSWQVCSSEWHRTAAAGAVLPGTRQPSIVGRREASDSLPDRMSRGGDDAVQCRVNIHIAQEAHFGRFGSIKIHTRGV